MENPLDNGYTFCAHEGSSLELTGFYDVAYGAKGCYSYLYNQSGFIKFDNNTFGDPIYGVKKEGYYKKIISIDKEKTSRFNVLLCPTIIKCAYEGDTVVFEEKCDICYGTDNGLKKVRRGFLGQVTFNDKEFSYPKNNLIKYGYELKNREKDLIFSDIKKPQLPTVTLLIIDCVNYERAQEVLEHCMSCCDFGVVKILTSLPCKNTYDVAIDPLTCIEDVSHFMIKKLADYFDTEHCLIVQHDGFIIYPETWTNDFLKYDYIGAPWPVSLLYPGCDNSYVVGNGGFSLRSLKLQKALQSLEIDSCHPEDAQICQTHRPALESLGMKFASKEVASIFSIENGTLDKQFGQHGRTGRFK